MRSSLVAIHEGVQWDKQPSGVTLIEKNEMSFKPKQQRKPSSTVKPAVIGIWYVGEFRCQSQAVTSIQYITKNKYLK